jgi:hypothetical protein
VTARSVLSFVAMQAGWFACVLGAARGHPWLGPAVVLAALGLHLRLQPSKTRPREVLVLGAAAALGLLIESALLRTGVTAVDGARVPPLWLVAMWPSVAAATAPSGSLGALKHRPLLGAMAGAVAAPIAYDAGARLGAICVAHDRLFVIGLAWSVVLPLLFALRSRLPGVPTMRVPIARVPTTKGEV